MTVLATRLGRILVAPFVGSFLGCVITRLPEGRPILWDRSGCDLCGERLAVRDLVPIISWFVLRGRCRHCGGKIALRTLLLELGAVAIPFWAATVAQRAMLWMTCILAWALTALAIIDLDEGVLPDILTIPLVALGLATAAYFEPSRLTDCIIGAFSGFIAGCEGAKASVSAMRSCLLHRAPGSRGRGCQASFSSASLVLVLLAAFREQRVNFGQRLAFGPALCFGTWVVWLYGPLS